MVDRVSILSFFNTLAYDQTDASLIALWDRMHVYPYPYTQGGDVNTLSGREGDRFMIQVPFQLKTQNIGGVVPVLNSVTMSVVAIKTGKQDFIIETETFNTSNSCIIGGQQSPSINTTRNYITFPNDPFNAIILAANAAYNSTATPYMKGYLFNYAMTLRYDFWNSIITTAPGGVTCDNDFFNDNPNGANAWSQLAANGWSLVLRCTWATTGYDGFVTTAQTQIAINCQSANTAPLTGPNYITEVQYFDANIDSTTYGQQVVGIIPGSKTRISIIATPDGSVISGYDSYMGTMFVDLIGTGGVTTRRFASTLIPVESGSPWSPAPKNGSPDTYIANGISINIFNSTGVLIIEGIYDDTILGWANQPGFAWAGGMQLIDDALQTAGGQDIDTAGGAAILP